jgi:hypothetical protein
MEIIAGAALFLAATALFLPLRFAYWIWKDGETVAIPWSARPTARFRPWANRFRTRDLARLTLREPGRCALIFMKRPERCHFDLAVFDALTGFAGAFSTAVDLSHRDGDRDYVITSHALQMRNSRIDGPHFAPLAACAPDGFVSIDISRQIDAGQLASDLERSIRNRAIRHKRFAPFSYLFGRTRPDRVTCSGLIGQAILCQPLSPLAQALDRALRERFTYGEITPADLARAAAILELRPVGSSEPVRKICVRDRLTRRLERR